MEIPDDRLAISSPDLTGPVYCHGVTPTLNQHALHFMTPDPALRCALEKSYTDSLKRTSDAYLTTLGTADAITVTADLAARDFVTTTIDAPCSGDIYGIEASERNGLDGYVAFGIGIVATRFSQTHDQTVSYFDQALTAHLVHERAHATAQATQKSIVMGQWETNQPNRSIHVGHTVAGMKTLHIRAHSEEHLTSVENSFLEEAFAEATAARYRVEQRGLIGKKLSVVCDDGKERDIPVGYCTFDTDDPSNYQISYAAFAAHALTRLERATGVDVYEQLVHSRQPEHEAESKRKIIQAIETVQKGLYRRIRQTPYTRHAFLAMYDEIVEAIDEHQTQSGSLPDSEVVLTA